MGKYLDMSADVEVNISALFGAVPHNADNKSSDTQAVITENKEDA